MALSCYSGQSGKSYFFSTISQFLCEEPDTILGVLTRYGADHGFATSPEQTIAWENQIFGLQEKLKNSGCSGDIIFEYDIVRMGKRIDVVLLIKHMVFSLEFKNGATQYLARDAEQAEDYALDLKNFHKESENLYVCPILVATNAPKKPNIVDSYSDKQVRLQYANSQNMMECISAVYEKYGSNEAIDAVKWYNSPYCPTPTIIEAAVAAYRDHSVSEIANSEAGQANIDACEEQVNSIVTYAKENHKKCICFITGVPGAGKTLVGLDLAAKNLSVSSKAVYLSGNGPLIAVLRQALINNTILQRKRTNGGKKVEKADRKQIEDAIKAFIQEAYLFRKDSLNRSFNESYGGPAENVVIFDEAQRCWNKAKMANWTKKKMNREIDESEPEFFIKTMNRKKEWAVIVCLVGLGQDIYDGEVGINEWFRSAIQDFPDWELFYSPAIFDQSEDSTIDRGLIEGSPNTHTCQSLHLSTSIRSFRSERQSEFVDKLLSNDPKGAKELYHSIASQYPIFVTRDIGLAKKYTRSKIRGSQRCGIVACSSAQRLKPEGIFVPTDIDVENWFLAPKEDIRSSNALEVVASEFKVQGLEVDYAIVCWDADLRRKGNDWDHYSFRGNKWNKRNKEDQKRYLINAYRVLLTRARQGMVVFVPKGEDPEIDPTRNRVFYDGVFTYLTHECGIQILEEAMQ